MTFKKLVIENQEKLGLKKHRSVEKGIKISRFFFLWVMSLLGLWLTLVAYVIILLHYFVQSRKMSNHPNPQSLLENLFHWL